MAFEVYKNANHPRVTISTSAVFYFNREACKQFNIRPGRFCVLYFDSKEKVIGFKFVDEPIENSVRIKNYNPTVGFSLRPFLEHFKIDSSVTHHYFMEKSEFIEEMITAIWEQAKP